MLNTVNDSLAVHIYLADGNADPAQQLCVCVRACVSVTSYCACMEVLTLTKT